MSILARLVYLADLYRPVLPSNQLLRYLPQGDFIAEVAKRGAVPASVNSDLSPDLVQKFLTDGRKPDGATEDDPGSADEFRYTISRIITDELDLVKDDTQLSKYLELTAELRDYLLYGEDALVETSEESLSAPVPITQIPKFSSGFTPFDNVTAGGFYQGIVTVQAKPGHGKTSLMLALMEAMRRTNAASELWFFEVEIPLQMMRYRTAPLRARAKFLENDRLVTGNFSTRQIIQRIAENPNPDRIIFIDGPDAMTAAAGEGRRFAIDAVYRDLIRIKEKAKLVVVSSQPRRKDGQLSMESVAESWGKAWYSDMILGIHRNGEVGGGLTNVMINCSKNRFGPLGGEIRFQFNYGDLSWDYDNVVGDW